MFICFPKHKLCNAARTWFLVIILTLSLIITSHLLHQAPSQNALQGSLSAILSGSHGNVSHRRAGHVILPHGRTKEDMWRVPPPGAKRHQLAIIKCIHRELNMCQVLKMLGYRIQYQLSTNQTADVIWSTKQSYAYKPGITKLISYMHGCKPLHNKDLLLTASNISVILPAFILPAEQQQFIKHMQTKGPSVLWIRKNHNHRGVRIVSNEELLSDKAVKEPYLVQEFMAKPFLISNRKFDMGIFAMVTSISPLRMYLYTQDFQVKFCVAGYLPFDPNILEKYVEESVLKKVWEIPALKNLSGTPGSRRDKDVLYEYLDNQGHSSQKVHERILSAASEVGSKKEREMAKWDSKIPIKSNRFEFLRFDMALQEDLSLMVIEINLSPVTFTAKSSPHKDMFLKVLTSTALMAGLVNTSWTDEQVAYKTDVKTVRDEEINIDDEGCKTCSPDICKTMLKCRVCSSCLRPRDKLQFKRAVLEHRRKKDWTRVVPSPFKNQEVAAKWKPLSDPLYLAMTEATQILSLWYHRKCQKDAAWCM